MTLKGGGGPGGGGLSPVLAEKIAALPEVQASTPIRLGAAEIGGSNTFLAAADPKTITQLYDFNGVSGSIDQPRAQRDRDLDAQGERAST